MAHILDVEVEHIYYKFILVESKFTKLCLVDFFSMPPNKYIDFCIDLELSTRPISIPPYHMALIEFIELKAQTQELLDKVFIRPSAFPLVALHMYLFYFT